MDTMEEGPDPDDAEAWRQAVESQSLRSVRGQCLVAAAQTIGPEGDQRLLNPIMGEITRRLMRMLRKRIGRNRRNEGCDMIEEAHGQLIEAVLKPDSADGKALRTAFVATVNFRAADAIRREGVQTERLAYAEDKASIPAHERKAWSQDEERAHVESVLRRIADPRKRLAFRLHLDGLPRNSTKGESIAKALGLSAKTVETWIKETEYEIKTILGVKP